MVSTRALFHWLDRVGLVAVAGPDEVPYIAWSSVNPHAPAPTARSPCLVCGCPPDLHSTAPEPSGVPSVSIYRRGGCGYDCVEVHRLSKVSRVIEYPWPKIQQAGRESEAALGLAFFELRDANRRSGLTGTPFEVLVPRAVYARSPA